LRSGRTPPNETTRPGDRRARPRRSGGVDDGMRVPGHDWCMRSADVNGRVRLTQWASIRSAVRPRSHPRLPGSRAQRRSRRSRARSSPNAVAAVGHRFAERPQGGAGRARRRLSARHGAARQLHRARRGRHGDASSSMRTGACSSGRTFAGVEVAEVPARGDDRDRRGWSPLDSLWHASALFPREARCGSGLLEGLRL